MKKKTLIAFLYNSAIKYPPTLSALTILADHFEKIILLETSSETDSHWEFPPNVKVLSNALKSGIRGFVSNGIALRKTLAKEKPDVVLLYDPMATLLYYIFSKGLSGKHLLWYHNHDIVESEKFRRWSSPRLAAAAEKKILRQSEIFTLPTFERLSVYQADQIRAARFEIPNYPSKAIISRFCQQPPVHNGKLKMIYQGSVTSNIGLLELIHAKLFATYPMLETLYIVGPIHEPTFREELEQAIRQTGQIDHIKILPPMPYNELLKFSAGMHIGIALLKSTNINYRTGGKASNKIYEYPAFGMPFIYYQQGSYKAALEAFPWAVGTDLSCESIREAVGRIISDYDKLSQQARRDFFEKLNYEAVLDPLIQYIRQAHPLNTM